MSMATDDPKLKTGDICPQCGKARLRVRTGRPVDRYQEQRLECTSCGFKDKTLVDGSTVRRRGEVL